MSSPRTVESELLAPAEQTVHSFVRQHRAPAGEARFQLLEAAAALLGGFPLKNYQARFEIEAIAPEKMLLEQAHEVVKAIAQSCIHPTLALSALARESLDEASRRVTGAYHTDFRLGARLAQLAAARLRPGAKVIDPACGAGMLLAAVTVQASAQEPKRTDRWLAEDVYAADRSPAALRGSLLALASFTQDLGVLAAMRARWRVIDSLMAPTAFWDEYAPGGFDVVIANPPWEKVKLTRHEYLKSQGDDRHYGAEVEQLDQQAFNQEKREVADYARRLAQQYPSLASGEPDLYIAFIELFERICSPGGLIAALVPAGLIRSQGTETIRRRLFEISERVSISVIENRARFFSIDTRFKFLAMACTKAAAQDDARYQPILLLHERGTPSELTQTGRAEIGRKELAAIRPDLSLPEVRSDDEWRIFRKMAKAGVAWDEEGCGWRPELCREVDMTRERRWFLPKEHGGGLPLIEGRMVQQFRVGAKGHVRGSGRRAVWENYPLGYSAIQPQFRIELSHVPNGAKHRAELLRGGFCDITGQTNERSMMATLIPPGVVCGNKVPTILFPDDPSEERLLVWAAVMNSIAFDWLLRRVITTTVNYFLLLSLPMPKIARGGLPWQRLAAFTRELRELDRAGHSGAALARAAQLRAEIDLEVARAYGLTFEELSVILQDFPLLDRGQPPLDGETRSTITRDTILATAAKPMRQSAKAWSVRVEKALERGATAYVPSEFSGSGEGAEEECASHDR